MTSTPYDRFARRWTTTCGPAGTRSPTNWVPGTTNSSGSCRSSPPLSVSPRTPSPIIASPPPRCSTPWRNGWRRASRLRPVLFVIDDGEWLDRQTAALLRRLADEAELGPLLLIVAHRDHEPRETGEVSKLVTSLRSAAGSSLTVRLSGLTIEETPAGRRLKPAAVGRAEQLHHESGGDPLYLGELLRAQRGANDGATDEPGGPTSPGWCSGGSIDSHQKALSCSRRRRSSATSSISRRSSRC